MTESNQHLADVAKEIAVDVVQQSMGSDLISERTLSLEIHDQDNLVSIYIMIGSETQTSIVNGKIDADITLKTNFETAREIKDKKISVSEALTNGRIKISGSVAEVISIANELGAKSR